MLFVPQIVSDSRAAGVAGAAIGIPLLLIWNARRGGFSGYLAPDAALELLNKRNAILIDLRSKSVCSLASMSSAKCSHVCSAGRRRGRDAYWDAHCAPCLQMSRGGGGKEGWGCWHVCQSANASLLILRRGQHATGKDITERQLAEHCLDSRRMTC